MAKDTHTPIRKRNPPARAATLKAPQVVYELRKQRAKTILHSQATPNHNLAARMPKQQTVRFADQSDILDRHPNGMGQLGLEHHQSQIMPSPLFAQHSVESPPSHQQMHYHM